MPKLQIPEAYRRSIASLATLSDAEVAALDAAFRNATSTSAAKIAASITPPIPNGQELVEAILPFYTLPEDAGVTLHQFVDDVVEAVRREWDENTRAMSEERFRSRLASLIAIPELATLTKAVAVLSDYERPFQSVKILTDLRPIFRDKPEDGAVGMGIVHILRITYDTPHLGPQDFFVALSSGDVQKFKTVIDRAEAKAMALRQALTSANIRYMEGE